MHKRGKVLNNDSNSMCWQLVTPTNQMQRKLHLLTIGGDELIEIYNSFEFPEAEPNANADITVAAVIEKFNEYFSPRSNELTTRYKFRKCVQRAGEQLDAFITRLKIILKECDYGDEKEKQLRDQIVFGCREDSLRDKFFREAALALQMTIHICTAHQASQKQMNSFREDRDETVAKIRETKQADSKRKYKSENTHKRMQVLWQKACVGQAPLPGVWKNLFPVWPR